MLTRRQFLQAAGIAAAAAHLPRLDALAPTAPGFDAVYGRALGTTPVYAAPDTASPLIKRLWGNTVVPIIETDGGWYRLPDGYALRENMQPMLVPARQNTTVSAPPFWAEVTGAVALARTFCAADAPICARVGHGGVLRVIDYLPGDGVDWYRVELDESDVLPGWVFTSVLSPVRVDDVVPTLSLAVDAEAQHLTVRDGDHVLLTAPFSTSHTLLPGTYPITERHLTDTRVTVRFGVPWSLTFGDSQTLSGAYWHNRFGVPEPGAALQVTPPLAKWLYPRAREVIIS